MATTFAYLVHLRWTNLGKQEIDRAVHRRKLAIREALRRGIDVLRAEFCIQPSTHDIELLLESTAHDNLEATARGQIDGLVGFLTGHNRVNWVDTNFVYQANW